MMQLIGGMAMTHIKNGKTCCKFVNNLSTKLAIIYKYNSISFHSCKDSISAHDLAFIKPLCWVYKMISIGGRAGEFIT